MDVGIEEVVEYLVIVEQVDLTIKNRNGQTAMEIT